MPSRPRSHILEEESVRRFCDALPPGWVYRKKSPDYGVDGEVEIFDGNSCSTGYSFNVQLRATDGAARSNRVRLEVDELDYYRSLDVPTAVVRYGSAEGSLFWQWSSNIASRVKIAEEQKTVTYSFSDLERWTEESPATIRRTLEVRRCLAAYPANSAVPLRIDLSAMNPESRYHVDRAIALFVRESGGSLTRANSSPTDIEVFARLEPTFLTVGIDVLSSVTFDLQDPTPDDYVTSILYALVRIFRRNRLNRHAHALGSLIADRKLLRHNKNLAFEACLAVASDLPKLVDLAIVNGLHAQGALYPLIALTIVKTPQDDELRRAAMDVFIEASLVSAREQGPTSEAAVHYSMGNFYRSQGNRARAAFHFNRARHLRSAYLQAEYFLREFAGILFVAGHHGPATRLYREASRLRPDDPMLIFLLGDSLLLEGAPLEARCCFETTLGELAEVKLLREAELKIMICNHLIAEAGSDTVPRRRSRANSKLQSDGGNSTEFLEHLLRTIDALNPLARYNLGITRSRQGDHSAALPHFLICACVQPHDIAAWANAAICALGLGDEVLLICILSTAIHSMGADAYDLLRARLVAQGIASDGLALLDEVAMQFLEECEVPTNQSLTLRILDGDSYHSMTIEGSNTIG